MSEAIRQPEPQVLTPPVASPAAPADTPLLEEGQVSIDGVNVRYVRGGRGQRVLLLHGWGGSTASWGPVLDDLLNRGYEVLAVDFPGFGGSDLPPRPWGVPDYAHNLRQLLLQTGFYPAHVIAHSFGGRVALVLAACWPELVRRMVLVAGAGIRLQSPRVRLIRALTKALKAVFSIPGLSLFKGRVQEALNRRFASSDYLQAGELRPTFARVVGQDLREYAARVRASTLLIWGELDTETPLAQAKVLESLIEDSGLVVLPGAGHFCYLERFPAFSRIVAEFLKD